MTPDTVEMRGAVRCRLHAAGWGLLFAWTGVVLVVPGRLDVLWHVWLVGIGTVLLGVSALALAAGLKPTWGSLILGTVALFSGVGGLAGLPVSLLGLALIGWGLAVIIGSACRRPRAEV